VSNSSRITSCGQHGPDRTCLKPWSTRGDHYQHTLTRSIVYTSAYFAWHQEKGCCRRCVVNQGPCDRYEAEGDLWRIPTIRSRSRHPANHRRSAPWDSSVTF
jgi:hypothetical protein